MENKRIYIGTITGIRGYGGEMKVSHLDIDDVHLPPDTEVYIGYSPNFSVTYKIVKWRQTKKQAKLELKGVDSDEKAMQFMETGIFIEEEKLRTISPETQITSDFIDMTVIDATSAEELGQIIDYWQLPANDVIVVRGIKQVFNVPNVAEFVTKIDYENKKIYINVIPGLMD
jgi:16S rRNA processing protein RimM